MNSKEKRNKLIGLISAEAAIVLVGLAVVVGNVVANTYDGIITKHFNQLDYKVIADENGEAPQYFTSKYSNSTELHDAQTAFAKEVQGEGTVLLKNYNNNLPMKTSGKVTIMGAASTTAVASSSSSKGLLVGGGGSGSIDVSQVPNLYKVFQDAGYTVNTDVFNWYEDNAAARDASKGTVGEPDISTMDADTLATLDQFNDAIVCFIGRVGSESSDLDPSYVKLSAEELAMIDTACAHSTNVIVMLNTMNAIELGPLTSRNVSVLWIGAGGQQGLLAYPEILNGKINPSGRLVDTYVADVTSAPAMQNFGNYKWTTTDEEFSAQAGNYVVYEEGIYVGYKYYETRYEDEVLNKHNAKSTKGSTTTGAWNYDDEVIYPFGFGGSYSSFSYSNLDVKQAKDGSYDVSVTVKNDSQVSGKETVEIYVQSPYTDGGLEKASVELVGFAKTAELSGGKSETLTINVSKESIASFDKATGSYVLDSGSYYFTAGTDAHNAVKNILTAKGTTIEGGSASLAKSVTIDRETLSGTKNEFEDVDINHYDSDAKYLSRKDWDGTYPTTYGEGIAEPKAQMITDFATPTVEAAGTMPTMGAKNGVVLANMVGKSYDDAKWEDLLDNLNIEDMEKIVGIAGYGTPVIESIAKPTTVDKDGPAGITSTLIGGKASFGYPIEMVFSSSFNTNLLDKYGEFIAEDGILTGTSGWYAPACNIHRTALGGRNFEYYSEDGLLSGKMAAHVVKTAKEGGVYSYVKHFALNEQETNRTYICTFANEQSIREIYLKGFELAVKEGGANGIMTSYNRIGVTWTGHHKGLLTDVLRNEWGFQGAVITDTMSVNTYHVSKNANYGLICGQDMWLCTSKTLVNDDIDTTNPTVVNAMREACHRCLYTVANSNAMNGVGEKTRIEPITPSWKYWLVGLDIALGAAFVVGSFFIIRKIVKNQKEKVED